MANSQRARSRAPSDPLMVWVRDTADAIAQAKAEIEANARRAYAMGQQVYADSRKPRPTGPSGGGPGAKKPTSQPASPPRQPKPTKQAPPRTQSPFQTTHQAGPTMPIFAAAKTLQNGLTFGLDDQLLALGYAAFGQGEGDTFFERYNGNYARQLAMRDSLQANYPVATAVGRTGALAAGLLTSNAAALAQAPRTAQTVTSGTRLVMKPREYVSAAGAGGVLNAGVQTASDAAEGKASVASTASSFLGGAVAAPVTLGFGAPAGGAIDGALTSLSRDIITGEPVSLPHLLAEGAWGALLGRVGEAAGTYRANALTPSQKGKLGESMSMAKTLGRWEGVSNVGKRLNLDGGGHTFTDHRTTAGDIVEAKFGQWADLSRRQRQAAEEYGDRYRVDRWLPSDAGKGIGYLSGSVVPPGDWYDDPLDRELR